MDQSPGEFALQLRSLREAQGLSLRALASIVGVSSVTVWKWEKGDSKPRPRLITPLAKALDVSPRRLQQPVKGTDGAGKVAEAGLPDALGAAATGGLADAIYGQDEARSQGSSEALPDVIARAKQMIAEASGTGSNNITIVIEY